LLDEIVTLASSGAVDEICDLGASNCARILEDVGAEAPEQPPVIVGTRVVEPDQNGDSRSTGGLVLELCGENRGETYYTEMLVFRENGELRAVEPVYWSGFNVEEDGTVGGPGLSGAPSDCDGASAP
jgi:hypothetical protein